MLLTISLATEIGMVAPAVAQETAKVGAATLPAGRSPSTASRTSAYPNLAGFGR